MAQSKKLSFVVSFSWGIRSRILVSRRQLLLLESAHLDWQPSREHGKCAQSKWLISSYLAISRHISNFMNSHEY